MLGFKKKKKRKGEDLGRIGSREARGGESRGGGEQLRTKCNEML